METIGLNEAISAQRGAYPSIVEHFSIDGLYGYRTVSLTSQYAATILIAKNGSGKTTLLGALDAFLKGQFLRLSEIQFTSITCKLRGFGESLRLEYSDIMSLYKITEDSDFLIRAKQIGLPPRVLLEFIENDYPALKSNARNLHDNEFFTKIMATVGYQFSEGRRICDQLHVMVRELNPHIDRILSGISIAIGNTEIVYLPTYRRIELPLSGEGKEDERHPGKRKQSVQARLGLSRRGLFNADIQFGLSDISERLAELNQEIMFNSNQGYREISANIINELLDGSFEKEETAPDDRPDKESLSLFFSRIKEGRRTIPYRDINIPDIDKVYGGGASSPQAKLFLKYFLGKLNTVIQATRGIEELVEEFINNCNRYLCGEDGTTSIEEMYGQGNFSRRQALDEKLLVLDRKSLKVLVHSVAANRRIPLDSLSSGEKQMISLFARLYLYPGQKIVLIDEPELSLSIDWQRKILIDIVNAPSCAQVIAITHSPFVFDNPLEPYAKSLSLRIDAKPIGEMEAAIEDELDE